MLERSDDRRIITLASRYLWTLPTTCVGLLFFLPTVLGRGNARVVSGVLELHGPLVRWFLQHCTMLPGGASAMTLGHVVIGRDQQCLDRTRAHERVHVRQCERWGPLFVPAYLLSSLAARLRGGNAYLDNAFEREAYHQIESHPADGDPDSGNS